MNEVLDDNPFFEIVPAQPFIPTPLEPNELFRGPWWSVYLENGRHELNYVTGHIASYEKRLPISAEEARQLMAGETGADSVLLAHGAD